MMRFSWRMEEKKDEDKKEIKKKRRSAALGFSLRVI